VHHESVRIGRVLDQIGAGFWPELDGCESHRRNFAPFVDWTALQPKVKLHLHLGRDPHHGNSALQKELGIPLQNSRRAGMSQ
jgi:imidazoleglycerol phosphate dehydratase HisB